MKVQKVFKYATGEAVPEGAMYLCTVKNGDFQKQHVNNYQYIWHYFLVEVEEKKE